MKKNKPSRFPDWLRGSWVRYVLFLGGAFLGVAATLAIVFVFIYKPRPTVDRIPPGYDERQVDQVVEEPTSTEDGMEEESFDSSGYVLSDSGTLNVDWQEASLLSRGAIESIIANSAQALLDQQSDSERNISPYWMASRWLTIGVDREHYSELSFKDMWLAGSVSNGTYAGSKVYMARFDWETMGGGPIYQYILKRPNTDRLLAIHSEDLLNFLGNDASFPSGEGDWNAETIYTAMDFAKDIRITSLEMPDEIVLQNGKVLYQKEFSWINSPSYRSEYLEGEFKRIGTSRDGYGLYQRTGEYAGHFEACVFAFAPDGLVYKYESFIPTISVDQYTEIPNITWSSQVAHGERYFYYIPSGCGGWSCPQIITEEERGPMVDLDLVGRTSEGEPIYAPSDPATHPEIIKLYDTWFAPGADTKPSIEEYLEKAPLPIFFWQDALGRWVMYHSSDAMPPVECGKPVIYLHPESKTDVHVSLPSFIDVTVSEPTYPAKGWNVTAEPNGQLMSHEDGNTYGSLYWEGTGVSYNVPETGFVVSDGNVETFLAGVLPKYGLNETETREFMEFWVPEMTGAPYYRVSFLTDDWSKAAPLHVSPRPNTSIRIFMDWAPLYAPISIEAPRISAPARDGFTLVEWGGTLYK